MTEIISLVLALLAGALLGVFFFGGLWWTVQQGLTSEWPAIWFLGSLIVRTAVVLGGFYFAAQGHWLRLATSLFGFVIARFAIMSRVKQSCEVVGPRSELEVPRAH